MSHLQLTLFLLFLLSISLGAFIPSAQHRGSNIDARDEAPIGYKGELWNGQLLACSLSPPPEEARGRRKVKVIVLSIQDDGGYVWVAVIARFPIPGIPSQLAEQYKYPDETVQWSFSLSRAIYTDIKDLEYSILPADARRAHDDLVTGQFADPKLWMPRKPASRKAPQRGDSGSQPTSKDGGPVELDGRQTSQHKRKPKVPRKAAQRSGRQNPANGVVTSQPSAGFESTNWRGPREPNRK